MILLVTRQSLVTQIRRLCLDFRARQSKSDIDSQAEPGSY